MKTGIMLIITGIMIFLLTAINGVNKKLDKLIEISTPEFVNVIPEEVIIEKH